MPKRVIPPNGLAGTFAACVIATFAAGAGPTHADSHGHGHDLHFGHPLIAESPSPDTKLRLDHVFRDEDGGNRHTVRLEGEYAFQPWFSIELDLPYTFLDPEGEPSHSNLDNVEVALKLASQVLAEQGVLLGGGLEIGLPSGDDEVGIGSDKEVEIAPFLDAGLKLGGFEGVGFVTFEVPTNEPAEEADEVDLKLAYNLSLMYRLSPGTWVLLEFDGESVVAGDDNETVINVTPGFKFQPFEDENLVVGFGVSAPLTSDEEFNARTTLSGFYHF